MRALVAASRIEWSARQGALLALEPTPSDVKAHAVALAQALEQLRVAER